MDITEIKKAGESFDDESTNVNEEATHVYPEHASELVGYDHLHHLCKEVRNESHSARGFLNPITNRLQYIMEALSIQGISFEFVPLETHNAETFGADDIKLANVMVDFKGTDETLPTIMFTAHHDIANANSENCQDNTASVSNLLHLCTKLKGLQNLGLLKQRVVVGFTDCEEAGGRGVNQVAKEIEAGKYGEIDCVYALELTACGNELWVSGLSKESENATKLEEAIGGDLNFVRTPYNESVNLRARKINACCIGILPTSEIEIVNQRSYCSTWALCHSMGDTFEKSANREDMNSFVDTMMNLIEVEVVG